MYLLWRPSNPWSLSLRKVFKTSGSTKKTGECSQLSMMLINSTCWSSCSNLADLERPWMSETARPTRRFIRMMETRKMKRKTRS